MLPALLSFLLLQAAWAACVLGAAAGDGLVGPLVTAGLLAAHLAWRPGRRAELRAILPAAATGLVLDSLLVSAGFLRFSAPGPLPELLVPVWIVALWAAFGATLRGALAWLAPRPLLAAGLSALGSPLSFLSARALGAVELAEPLSSTLAVLAVQWAVLVPVLLRVAHPPDPAPRRALATGPAPAERT